MQNAIASRATRTWQGLTLRCSTRIYVTDKYMSATNCHDRGMKWTLQLMCTTTSAFSYTKPSMQGVVGLRKQVIWLVFLFVLDSKTAFPSSATDMYIVRCQV